jgi:hypothetical protein
MTIPQAVTREGPTMTNGDHWRRCADQMAIPPRTLDNVKETIRLAKRQKADAAMARVMLKHGRLTDEARAWLASEYWL